MDRWVDRAIKWSYFVGTSLRHPVLGWGASSSLTGLVDSCWIWNERRNTHCFFLPNIGEAADRSPENNARKMRLWSTSSHWEVLQPNSWRKGIRASSLITWLSGAPRFPWTLSAPFLPSFRVTSEASQQLPRLTAHLLRVTHLTLGPSKQTQQNERAGFQESAEVDVSLLPLNDCKGDSDTAPASATDWMIEATKEITAKIPVVLQCLLFCFPPSWSWTKRFCREPHTMESSKNVVFPPSLGMHCGQWLLRILEKGGQCPWPFPRHFFILYLKETGRSSVHHHLPP